METTQRIITIGNLKTTPKGMRRTYPNLIAQAKAEFLASEEGQKLKAEKEAARASAKKEGLNQGKAEVLYQVHQHAGSAAAQRLKVRMDNVSSPQTNHSFPLAKQPSTSKPAPSSPADDRARSVAIMKAAAQKLLGNSGGNSSCSQPVPQPVLNVSRPQPKPATSQDDRSETVALLMKAAAWVDAQRQPPPWLAGGSSLNHQERSQPQKENQVQQGDRAKSAALLMESAAKHVLGVR